MKVIVALLSLLAATSAVKITDCRGTATLDMGGIDISGCDPRAPKCIFKKGTSAAMSLPFTPSYEVSGIKAEVTAYIGPLPIPFSLPNNNGCVDSGLTCPLQAGQKVTYTAALPIRTQYPPISLNVQWVLKDQQNRKLLCIKFPVQVKN